MLLAKKLRSKQEKRKARKLSHKVRKQMKPQQETATGSIQTKPESYKKSAVNTKTLDSKPAPPTAEPSAKIGVNIHVHSADKQTSSVLSKNAKKRQKKREKSASKADTSSNNPKKKAKVTSLTDERLKAYGLDPGKLKYTHPHLKQGVKRSKKRKVK